jgi:hypothetical protein
MSDETKPAPAATPAASPAPAPAPAPAAPTKAPESKVQPRTGASLITNPAPPVDPDAPAKEELPPSVPQSTLDEMAAGKKALERNKPVATALEKARDEKSGTITTPETNPVDATQTLRQQGKV